MYIKLGQNYIDTKKAVFALS